MILTSLPAQYPGVVIGLVFRSLGVVICLESSGIASDNITGCIYKRVSEQPGTALVVNAGMFFLKVTGPVNRWIQAPKGKQFERI